MYLSQFRYFWKPLDGLEDLHRRGTDYVADEIKELFKKRKIYGRAIEHYKQHAYGKPCLVYCRSIESASETAQRFCDAGFHFENIDGTMSYKQRQKLIQALRDGHLHGLTSCELITYGLDVPRVECIIMLRPTLSRTLYFQMLGRGLRIWSSKKECIILDHVNNVAVHGHPLTPVQWDFNGREKKARKPKPQIELLKLCPEIDYLYCTKETCAGCEHNAKGHGKRDFKIIEAQLEEIKRPVRTRFLPLEARQEINEQISNAVKDFKTGDEQIMSEAISKLLEIAKQTKRKPTWVYRQLEPDSRLVNVSILHEIARQKKYKPGWVWMQKKQIHSSNIRKARK